MSKWCPNTLLTKTLAYWCVSLGCYLSIYPSTLEVIYTVIYNRQLIWQNENHLKSCPFIEIVCLICLKAYINSIFCWIWYMYCTALNIQWRECSSFYASFLQEYLSVFVWRCNLCGTWKCFSSSLIRWLFTVMSGSATDMEHLASACYTVYAEFTSRHASPGRQPVSLPWQVKWPMAKFRASKNQS